MLYQSAGASFQEKKKSMGISLWKVLDTGVEIWEKYSNYAWSTKQILSSVLCTGFRVNKNTIARNIGGKSQKNVKVGKKQAHFYGCFIKWLRNCSSRPRQMSEYYVFYSFLPVFGGLSCNPPVLVRLFYWLQKLLHHTVPPLTLLTCPAVVCIFAIPSECDHGQWRRWQMRWLDEVRQVYSLQPCPNAC